MRLKKLIVHGFKSFADRTEFVFDCPITGIVGPNGCGKSNVVDAVKWVLGEQSAKSLRGEAMLDVIFNGSSTRKPGGMSEVTLVFDNPRRPDGTRHLNLDSDEVSVGRRLFRDGTSEYQLNNQAARLKDVRELFLDTGIGVDAYSMIEQGRVALLLESNPQERRQIFEEAAGISKFKAKKKEAQRKLDRVDQNLLRVTDIVEEVEKRLRSVKIQAGRARTFQEHSQRLKELRLTYALQEYHILHEQLEQRQKAESAARAKLEEITTDLSEKQLALNENKRQYDSISQQKQRGEYELVQTKAAMQSAQQRQQYAQQQLQQIADQLEQFERDRTNLTRKAEEVAGQLGSEEESLKKLTEELSSHRRQIEQKQQEFHDTQLQLNQINREIEQNKSAILDLMRRAAGVNNRLGAIEIERKNIANQQERLALRRQVLAGEIEVLEAARKELDEALSAVLGEIKSFQAELEESTHEAAALGKQIAQISEQLGSAREHRSGLLSRQKLLEDLEAKREGVSEGVKEVLRQRAEKYPFVRGLVADVLRVDVEHAQVIEAALDGRDQLLIADDHGAVLNAQEELEDVTGRVAILCVDELESGLGFRVSGFGDELGKTSFARPGEGLESSEMSLRAAGVATAEDRAKADWLGEGNAVTAEDTAVRYGDELAQSGFAAPGAGMGSSAIGLNAAGIAPIQPDLSENLGLSEGNTATTAEEPKFGNELAASGFALPGEGLASSAIDTGSQGAVPADARPMPVDLGLRADNSASVVVALANENHPRLGSELAASGYAATGDGLATSDISIRPAGIIAATVSRPTAPDASGMSTDNSAISVEAQNPTHEELLRHGESLAQSGFGLAGAGMDSSSISVNPAGIAETRNPKPETRCPGLAFKNLAVHVEPAPDRPYDWNQHPQRIRLAADLVIVEPENSAVAQHLLGRTVVVDTLADAVELHRDGPDGWRYVTMNAEVVEADGTVRIGPLTAAMGLISRRSELEALKHQIAEVDGRIEQLTSQVAQGTAQAKALQEKQNALRNSLYQANTKKVQTTSRISQNADRQSSSRRELPVVEKELANYLDQVGRLKTEGTALLEKRQAMECEQASRQKQVEELTAKQAEGAEVLKQAGEALTSLRVQLGAVQEKQIASQQAVQRLKSAQVELSQQIERIEHTAGQVADRRESVQQELESAQAAEEQLIQKQEVLARKIEELAGQVEELGQRVNHLSEEVSEVQASHGEVEQSLHQVALQISEVRVRLENLVQRTMDEIQLDLPTRYSELEQQGQGGYQPAEMDWNAVAEEIKQLKEKIQRLGNVNLDAIGEQDELEQRQTFLSTQVGDLTQSKQQLEQLIDEINKESSLRFEQTFNAVREHFQGMFRKLFGGGKADIYLETSVEEKAEQQPVIGPDGQAVLPIVRKTVDPLDAGIEIIAKPPGKQPCSISQLSGGEKTMTCVALLMSIFKSKPSPFCILDEVDAALDEANNQRFNLIVQEFLEQSQFIIITHSKRTMQIADVLYGVTMQEQGVSKRVAARFDQVGTDGTIKAEEHAAA